MTTLGRTKMLDGRWVEPHKTTFKGGVGYIIQDGKGQVVTHKNPTEAFKLYKEWAK